MKSVKLITPLVLLVIFSSIIGAIFSNSINNPYLYIVAWCWAALFGVAGVVTFMDYIADHAGDRVYKIRMGRIKPMIDLAKEIKELDHRKLDAVLSVDRSIIEVIVGDDSPIYMCRVGVGTGIHLVPRLWLADFLEESMQCLPYLQAESANGNRMFWRIVVDFFFKMKWAEKWAGPHTAKLIIPPGKTAEEVLEAIAAKWDIQFTEGD